MFKSIKSKAGVTFFVTRVLKLSIICTLIYCILQIVNSSLQILNSSFTLRNSSFQILAQTVKKCPPKLDGPWTPRQQEEIKMLQELMLRLQKKHPKLKIDPSLAPKIMVAAHKHGVSSRLLASIVAVESKFQPRAYNRRSKDYGLGQINIKSLFARGRSPNLVYNIEYNLDLSALILAEKQKRFATRELNWYCRYNVGTGKMRGKVLTNCEKYAKLVMVAYKN